MQTIDHWLQTQTAADIMSGALLCLKQGDRLADSVKLFVANQISGAPVVDEDGVCVGVLTVTDVMGAFSDNRGRPAQKQLLWQAFEDVDPYARRWHELAQLSEASEPRSGESVATHMTRDIVSVSPETTLEIVIRRMIDAHVHRVLVLDGLGRLRGVITTTDILAAILRTTAK